jgi:hypothetical protein
MNSIPKYFSVCALALFTQAAFAQTPQGFAVLSAADNQGGAVTCTDSTISGDVGSSGLLASVVRTNCTISGSVVAPVSAQVVAGFDAVYAGLGTVPCGTVLTTLDGQVLSSGTYCFDAAATSTGGVLTLVGSGPWLFKVGTLGTGALTGTNFTMITPTGAACTDIVWQVAQAVTMTDSQFAGVVYAGAAITVTGGTYTGDALAKAAVTLTGTTLTGCLAGTPPPPAAKQKCNQGVGNGTEGCDPGNSNQGNPFRSNDELGGVPGNPGRKGGNK